MPKISIEKLGEFSSIQEFGKVIESIKLDTDLIGLNIVDDSKLIISTLDSNNKIRLFELDLREVDPISLFSFFEDIKVKIVTYDLKSFYKKIETLILTKQDKDNKSAQLKSEIKHLIFPKDSLCIMLAGFIQNSSLAFELQAQAERNLKPDVLADLIAVFNVGEKLDTGAREAIVSLFLGKYYIDFFDVKTLKLWQDIESPIAIILAKMELNGVFIDKDKLQDVSNELQKSSIELQEQVLDLLETPTLNLNSPSQLGKVLVERGFKLKASSSGKISTDREVLEGLESEDESGVIAKVLEYRTVSKLFSTYTDSFLKLLDQNSRIHGTYNQVQAPTGRLSSNNPNLQNIPIRNPKYGPLIRSTFSAPKNRQIIAADYSQMELRLLAHFCQDPVLIDAFAQNQDIHARTSAEIFEVPINEVTKEQRRTGKTLNFALVYQQGSQATAKQLGIKTKEATAYIEKYFSRFAKVKPFVEEVLGNARKNGYVETLYGRRRYFENLNSGNDFVRKIDERAAFNAVLQGSNADVIKLAMINLEDRMRKENLDGSIVLQVHDELVLEVNQDQSQIIKEVVVAEMEVGQPLRVPILVEAGIGQNWAEAK